MPAPRRRLAAGFWSQRIARRPSDTVKLSPRLQEHTLRPQRVGPKYGTSDYFCLGARRARRRVRSEEAANTPPASPASTSVGFSGEFSQPPCARAGRAKTRGNASATDRMALDRMALFIVDPYMPADLGSVAIESFLWGLAMQLQPCAQGEHHCCLEYVMSEYGSGMASVNSDFPTKVSG